MTVSTYNINLITTEDIQSLLDYCNFKNNVHDELPDDNRYQDFLMRVWSGGLNMQEG